MHAEVIKGNRGPQIEGTRITVFDILDYVKQDWPVEQIADWLQISPIQVEAAVEYIDNHKQEVEEEYQKILAREAKGNPPEIQARLEASHQKLQARLAQKQEVGANQNGAGNPGRQK